MIAVTGLGVMAPHGADPDTVFDALLRGESAVRPVCPELARAAAAATVPGFDPAPWFTRLQLAGVDRVSQLAVAAAARARQDAALPDDLPGTRVGVYVGCALGGGAALEAAFTAHARGSRMPPLSIPASMANAPAALVALRQRVLGPVLTYAVACASSAIAIAEAAKALRCGEIDVALAGGAEALIVPGVVHAWQAMQTLARLDDGPPARACRPFAADRSGFVLGEGAAFLVLETLACARARGARVHAELAGWGLGNDAHHLTAPDAAGQARTLRAALALAGLAPSEIGYCNAHGTATPVGDVVEAEALREVWGAALPQLAVSSTKALHGHLLGAAGALEAVVTVLALQRRRLPPNAHCEQPDPACALPLVPAGGAEAPTLSSAISNSFAFGGSNAVLVFRRA
ncbi:MAG: beta-ketoacyl-[acyl-carrier-protein] synthase family protein [Rubrivivax sp.]